MADLKDMPQAEFEVMEVLWDKKRATVKDVHKELSKARKLAYTTVATLLTRLKEKGYVGAEEVNFAYMYRPLVAKENVVKRKLDDLVSRILGGSLAPLAAYIAENKNLTPEQINMLEDIVTSEKSKKEPEND